MKRRASPMSAVAEGFLAGAFGALMQSAFFKLTSRITPEPPRDAFEPPEPRQKEESSTETVARRWITGLMKRPEPSSDELARGGRMVHVGFGALWGVPYALLRESLPRPNLAIVLGYGAFVWMVSDNFILPAFKLAAWPQAYPAKSHAYAVAAHFAYAAAVFAAYESLRVGTWRRAPAILRGAAARIGNRDPLGRARLRARSLYQQVAV